MMPNPPSKSAVGTAALLALLLLGYGRVLTEYFVPVTGGTDQNGYHVSGWMVADQGRFSQTPEDEFEFIGYMWVKNDRGDYYPKYPPLYPLLAGGVIRITGQPHAGFWLSPVCALLTVAGVYVLFRNFLSRSRALAGAVFMAGTPVFLYYALNKASHAPSMAFSVWGLAGFFGALSKPLSKRVLITAGLGGFLLGFSVGIRYTNLLLFLPPAVYSLCYLRGRRWRIPLSFALGALIPGLFLAVYHHRAFGAFWRTGYALTQEQSGFSTDYFLTNLRLYSTGLLNHATGPVTLFAVLGLVLLFFRRPGRALVYLVWLLPLLLVYSCYYWAPSTRPSGYLRFVMPAAVPMYLLALLGLKETLGSMSAARRRFCLAAVVGVQLLWGGYQGLLQAEQRWMRDRLSAASVDFAAEHIPETSVVFTDSGLLNDLDFGKRWHLVSLEVFDPNRVRRLADRSLETEVHPLQKERVERWKALLLDPPRKEVQQLLKDYVQGHLDDRRRVFLLGTEQNMNNFRNRNRRLFDIQYVETLSGEIPAFRWIHPNRSSMRNEKPDRERNLPKQTLLEITAVHDRHPTRDQLREDLIRERQEKLQEFYRDHPEGRALLLSLENLQRQISRLKPPPRPEPEN